VQSGETEEEEVIGEVVGESELGSAKWKNWYQNQSYFVTKTKTRIINFRFWRTKTRIRLTKR